MLLRPNLLALALLAALGGSAARAADAPPAPDSAATLEARVGRLERQLDNQAVVDMATRLDSLQQEVQRLRGQVELQGHTIDELKDRQRNLYLDIDRRMSRLEREGGGMAPPPAPAAGAGVVAPATPAVPVAPAAPVAPAVPVVPAGPSAAVSAPAAPAPAAPPPAVDKEREAYQQAFDLLRDLRYDQAIAAFRSFLKQYPDGRYGHIAQYWVAEADYAQRDFKQAIVDYRQLIDRYPRSPKVAEAMLKIGYSDYEIGDKAGAKKVLTDLTQRYPDSTEAGQANAFLQKMRGEGN